MALLFIRAQTACSAITRNTVLRTPKFGAGSGRVTAKQAEAPVNPSANLRTNYHPHQTSDDWQEVVREGKRSKVTPFVVRYRDTR